MNMLDGIVAEKNRQQNAVDRHKAAFAADPNTLSFSSKLLFGRKNDKLQEIKLEDIEVGAQVRKTFIDAEITELAASIKEYGLLQPVSVYAVENGRYHLVCGEKRYRACTLAGLAAITAYVIDPPKNEAQLLALQIIENMHRSNPPTFEIAAALAKLEQSGLKIEDICTLISCSREMVYQMLRFDKLSDAEKQVFCDYPKLFLLRYCRIKHSRAQLAQKLLTAAAHCSHEAVCRMAEVFYTKISKQQDKSAASARRSADIRFSLSFSELDKIQPETSAMYRSYMERHPDETEKSVIAKALTFYLSSISGKVDVSSQDPGDRPGAESA